MNQKLLDILRHGLNIRGYDGLACHKTGLPNSMAECSCPLNSLLACGSVDNLRHAAPAKKRWDGTWVEDP